MAKNDKDPKKYPNTPKEKEVVDKPRPPVGRQKEYEGESGKEVRGNEPMGSQKEYKEPPEH